MLPKRLADSASPSSVATRLRRQRFQLFLDMLTDRPGPVSVLDVGGSQGYWEMMLAGAPLGDRLRVTLLNVSPQAVSLPNFSAMVGDGRSMRQFADKQFDIVFSNSTIEHVGGSEDQRRMADEVKRVGKRYYLQTPNRYFPIEPHFLFPGFQFLPLGVRAWLLQHFDLGSTLRQRDLERARAEVAGIRLLSKAEVRELFPEAVIHEERVYGLVKSFVAFTPEPL
jgi:hypothetical protein